MDKRDFVTACTDSGLLVYQTGSLLLQACEFVGEIGDAKADMVQAFAVSVEEARQRQIACHRRDKFNARVGQLNKANPDLLVGDIDRFRHGNAKNTGVKLFRLFNVADGDGNVLN